MVKYMSIVFAATFAIVAAAPVDQPVCKVVTAVYSGEPLWVPNPDPTTAWSQWATTSSEASAVTTTDPVTWSEWSTSSSSIALTTFCPPALSTYTVTPCWTVEGTSTCTAVVKTSTITGSGCTVSWTPTSSSQSVVPTTSASVSVSQWSAWTSSVAAVTTTTTKSSQPVVTTTSSKTTTSSETTTTSSKPVYTTTSATTIVSTTPITTASTTTTTTTASTTASTTTTTTAAPKATCPASSGSNVLGGGSCDCSFTVNCGVRSVPTQDSKFWERTSGETIETLAECLAICDDNSECTAAIWTDDSTASSSDYHRCWQTSGLPQPSLQGYGQISYKDSCSGTCSSDYNGGQ